MRECNIEQNKKRDVEKTYDRSIERFIKTFQERGQWW